MSARLTMLAFVVATLLTSVVHAHPLSPPALFVREESARRYHVSFRRSELAAPRLRIDWPDDCTLTLERAHHDSDQLVDESTLVCRHTLAGQTLRSFGLLELELSMLVHLELHESEAVHALISPEYPSLVIPERSTPLTVLSDYVGLGVGHLLSGPDHILFVLGLMLLVHGWKARLLALTAFTLGHSVTLCLSALSVISLPQAPVEVGIAASLLVLALEVLEPRARQRERGAWLMASSFGLLHGLGFASALIDTGLPPHAVPLSLFGFNLGVELGQLLVVAALLPCLYLASRLQTRHALLARNVTAYAIGSLAAMWCLERALVLL